LHTVKGNLIARGIAADGTTEAERASSDFDARNFALVAIGGGVDGQLRETLKSDFRRQNPDVILLRLHRWRCRTSLRRYAAMHAGERSHPVSRLHQSRVLTSCTWI